MSAWDELTMNWRALEAQTNNAAAPAKKETQACARCHGFGRVDDPRFGNVICPSCHDTRKQR